VRHDDDKESDLERLRVLVESYGSDPERWPAEERHAFERLSASVEARAWLAEQRRLDAWLARAEDVEPSPALLRRVAEIPVRQGAPRAWVWPFGRLRNAVAVAAAAATMGMVVGLSGPELSPGDGHDEWDELSTLAFGTDLAEEAP
jgi:hypothetical protein